MRTLSRLLAVIMILFFACTGCAKRVQLGENSSGKDTVISYLSSIEGPEGESKFRELVGKGDEILPAVIDALGSPDADVAEAAAGVLGEMGAVEAVPHLVTFLKSDRKRRYAAAWALGEIRDPSSIFSLIDALDDSSEGVVKAATRAIIKIGKQAVPLLMDSIGGGSTRKREAILIAFEDIGDTRAEETVRQVLQGENERVLRIRAARALGKCGTGESVSALISALKEDDVDLIVASAWSLGILEAGEALPVLKEMLGHEDTGVREWSARALENITGERVFYKNAKGDMVLPYNLYR